MRKILPPSFLLAALPLSAATQYPMNVEVAGRFPSSFAARSRGVRRRRS
jgi:hypothetical protein